ncbi:MAG: NAD(P)/FAD-dependent oxidoreductase [Candidatus Dormibacteria bacterium]
MILGGGIAGLCMAWEAARRGLAPVVIRGATPPTSLAAAGMLAPMPESSALSGLALFAVEGLRHYPTFLDELGEDSVTASGFSRPGLLRLAYSDEEATALREGVGTYEAAGMPSRWLSVRGCLDELPGLNPDALRGGLLSYDEAQVQPGWLLALLERRIAVEGGVFRGGEAVRVRGGAALGDGAEVELSGGEVVDAEQVVVAAGSWSGLLEGVFCPVRPVRGQLLVISEVPLPSRILFVGHDYLVAKADGTLVVGGTMEEDSGFSLEPSAAADRLRALLRAVWPAAMLGPVRVQVGLRPAAPDDLPLIGQVPGMPAVHLFTAHHRNGFLLSPLGARLLAGEIFDREPARLLTPYRPGRFVPESTDRTAAG